MDETTTVPRDEFSRRLRELRADPGAVRRESSIELTDFYGNVVTWVIVTMRADGRETVFLQRQDSVEGKRWVLPAEVTAAIARHRDGAIAVARRRGARQAAATRATARKGAK